MKKAKSPTLNTEEVNTFVEMSEKIPSVVNKVLASSVHQRKKESVSSIDSEVSDDEKKKNKENWCY